MSRPSVGIFGALVLLGTLGSGCLVNQPPEVRVGPRPNSLVVSPGGELMMQLEVEDPDGDKMTYDWAQIPPEPAGRFSDVHARNPTWTAPAVTETMVFTLSVTVSDNEGGGVLGTTPSVVVRVQ